MGQATKSQPNGLGVGLVAGDLADPGPFEKFFSLVLSVYLGDLLCDSRGLSQERGDWRVGFSVTGG